MPGYKNNILYSLWTRYKFVPLYLKVLPILLLLSAIFLFDQELIPNSLHPEVLHRLYYLPIILSGLLFGLRGGDFLGHGGLPFISSPLVSLVPFLRLP